MWSCLALALRSPPSFALVLCTGRLCRHLVFLMEGSVWCFCGVYFLIFVSVMLFLVSVFVEVCGTASFSHIVSLVSGSPVVCAAMRALERLGAVTYPPTFAFAPTRCDGCGASRARSDVCVGIRGLLVTCIPRFMELVRYRK